MAVWWLYRLFSDWWQAGIDRGERPQHVDQPPHFANRSSATPQPRTHAREYDKDDDYIDYEEIK